MPLKKKKIMLKCGIVFTAFFIVSHFIRRTDRLGGSRDRRYFIQSWPADGVENRNRDITVLIWNRMMKDLNWTDFYGNFNAHSCSSKCKFTFNRKLINISSVVLFNARRIYQDMHTDGLPFDVRTTNQIWILHGTEPPWKIYLDFSKYQSVFNWTSFPRPDSDLRTFYGNYERVSEAEEHPAKLRRKQTEEAFGRRNKLIGWVVSNCHSENKREEYVKELMKYVPVDIYGQCSQNSGTVEGDRIIGRHNISKYYKFYLAFENANCRGYITEKFWNALAQGSIPVVMGDPDAYKRYAPPGSYIDTARFESAEHLASYLRRVATYKSEYRTYFDWIEKFKLVNDYWCQLCTAAHQWDGVHQVYTDLRAWYAQDSCRTWNLAGFMVNVLEEVLRFIYNPTPFPSSGFNWRFSLGPIGRPVKRT